MANNFIARRFWILFGVVALTGCGEVAGDGAGSSTDRSWGGGGYSSTIEITNVQSCRPNEDAPPHSEHGIRATVRVTNDGEQPLTFDVHGMVKFAEFNGTPVEAFNNNSGDCATEAPRGTIAPGEHFEFTVSYATTSTEGELHLQMTTELDIQFTGEA